MELETHPWEPFIPDGARVMILGTFPPPQSRWSMNFFYPNKINDFWRIMGYIFYGDRDALLLPDRKGFDLDAIVRLLVREGIALGDTGHKARRLKGNASDKFLEIVEPIALNDVLTRMPDCHNLATTGEKAAQVLASITGTEVPSMGEYVMSENGLKIWRMPSTSRAYPLALDRKAEYYSRLFDSLPPVKQL